MRSRKAGDLNAEILEGHLSAALCHMANISHRLGAETEPNVIADMAKGNSQWADAFLRLGQHAQRNGIDLNQTQAVLGPWVTIDSESEKFVDEFAGPANQLLRRDYREPFVVPENV